jgi:hypothetical protein
MSRINTFTPNDPEYYAEVFSKTSRPADRRQPSGPQSCIDIPGIQDVDDSVAKRLQTLLHVIADISLCKRGNFCATTACLKYNGDTLETRLFIAFNHENDTAAGRCSDHLNTIFEMLRKVDYTPPERGSPKFIEETSKPDFFRVCEAIHNYSFDIFAYRVNKREHKLSEIRGYVEKDVTHFTDRERRTLLTFLLHVDGIIKIVAKSQARKRLRFNVMDVLLSIYRFWTTNDLLPEDELADNKPTLLGRLDSWLAKRA